MKNTIKNLMCISMVAIGGWYMTVMSQKDIETPSALTVPTPPTLHDMPMVTQETMVETVQQEPSVSMTLDQESGEVQHSMPTEAPAEQQPEQQQSEQSAPAEQPMQEVMIQELSSEPMAEATQPEVPVMQEPTMPEASHMNDIDMLVDQLVDKLVVQKTDMLKESVKQKLHDTINEVMSK